MKGMFRRAVVCFILLVFMAGVPASCSGPVREEAGTEKLALSGESRYIDYTVQNECVYLQCRLVVVNSGGPIRVSILAASDEDVGALLSDRRLKAWSGRFDPNDTGGGLTDVFELEKGVNELDVYFEGSWLGNEDAVKHDGELPGNITFTEAKSR